jgi:hypothetical protein
MMYFAEKVRRAFYVKARKRARHVLIPNYLLENPHPVGASLLANLLKIFASKLAPTLGFRPDRLFGLIPALGQAVV